MDSLNTRALEAIKTGLKQAEKGLVELIADLSSQARWDWQRRATDWAQQVRSIRDELPNALGDAAGTPAAIPVAKRPSPSVTQRLPYFYVDAGDVVLRGPSRTHEFYEHRIPKEHYDLVLDRLADLAAANHQEVLPSSLQDRDEMPIHEPGEVIRLLAQEGLLVKVRRGRYRFKDRDRFASEARKVWSSLPDSLPGAASHQVARPTPLVPPRAVVR
jgi:hypothetical protein